MEGPSAAVGIFVVVRFVGHVSNQLNQTFMQINPDTSGLHVCSIYHKFTINSSDK